MKEDNSRILSFGGALVGDIVSTLVPGGGLFSKLVDQHLAQKTQEAVEIALQELSRGNVEFDEEDAQPFVAVLLRYSKAASEGAARRNLRLLMQIVVGLKRNKALREDAFRRWAGIVEHMTRDELMLVGQAIRLQGEIESGAVGEVERFWGLLLERMQEAGYSERETAAIAAAVSRSGLVIPVSAYGGLAYRASPWLSELYSLVDSQTFVSSEDE
ncbi:hypothetical protein MUU53_06915 [Rhizobium lemnae]|uniref:Uncharacterized protein n=1 Tax=Rhizobium lemnae TaxID=1214924 RepID=A0ABV8E5G8_9HYPH|nr:hypothetical protein [Rhizobium lemnae]MCJ8507644.1 hypothetical protein [Rhizobium lemnae]